MTTGIGKFHVHLTMRSLCDNLHIVLYISTDHTISQTICVLDKMHYSPIISKDGFKSFAQGHYLAFI